MVESLLNQKRSRQAAWLFGIGGIVILAAGILRVRGLLYQPFFVHGEEIAITQNDLGDTAKDTDQDGLRDADELIRGTSPFLADTDSDGVSDGEEVKKQTDPLCPQGKDCAKTEPAAAGGTAPDLLGPGGSTNPGSLADLLNIKAGGAAAITAAEARVSLKGAGIQASLLDQLDDATVLELYTKTVATAGATPEQIASTNPVKTMTAAELRILLIRSGIDAKKLEKLTDEQVVQLVEETLKGDKKE